jgi:hypothetical protein
MAAARGTAPGTLVARAARGRSGLAGVQGEGRMIHGSVMNERPIRHRAGRATALACNLLCVLACSGWPLREPRPAPALDVAIRPFDPGAARSEPSSEFDELLAMLGFGRVALPVSAAVRRAESQYLPHLLRRALADEGSWGSLWILPETGCTADLELRARIAESDGEQLILEIEAIDASGEVWLRQPYATQMDAAGYRMARALPEADPAQPLFAALARDLARERDRRGSRALQALRRTAELRFASELAPEVFAPYLHGKDSAIVADPLPAELETQRARVRQLRAYDTRVAAALTEQSQSDAAALREPYREWRSSSLEQIAAFRVSMRQAGASVAATAALLAAGAALGNNVGTDPIGDALRTTFGLAGIYAAKPGVDRISEARGRAEAFAERSLLTEERTAGPLVAVMDSQRVRLTGSRAEQLEKWRRFLRTRYESSSGAVPGERFELYFESAPIRSTH